MAENVERLCGRKDFVSGMGTSFQRCVTLLNAKVGRVCRPPLTPATAPSQSESSMAESILNDSSQAKAARRARHPSGPRTVPVRSAWAGGGGMENSSHRTADSARWTRLVKESKWAETTALTPALSPRRGRNMGRDVENSG